MKRFPLFLIALLLAPRAVFAASAGLTGPAEVQVGRTFQVRMTVGGAVDVDTVRFVGSFPTDLLEFQGMANGSSLPTRSPGSGATGGTFNFGGFSLGNPVNGGTQAGVLTFRAKKIGEATISLQGGTRILSAGEDQTTGRGSLKIKIVEAPAPGEIPVTPPVQTTIDLISRTHPDQDTWYPKRDLGLEWKFTGRQPISYAVGFDQAPEGPAETKAVATSSASFIATSDGVWYGHLVVRYSASEIVRKDFRFLVDTSEPRPLAVAVDQTDVRPGTPNYLRFAALDDASGISHYEVTINDVFVTSTSLTSLSLASLGIGDYRVRVRAIDMAGNFSQGVTEFGLIEAPGTATAVDRAERIQDSILRLLLTLFVTILLFLIGVLVGRRMRKKTNKKRLRS
jgi:hypothetical protein